MWNDPDLSVDAFRALLTRLGFVEVGGSTKKVTLQGPKGRRMEMPRSGGSQVWRRHVEHAARLLHISPDELLAQAADDVSGESETKAVRSRAQRPSKGTLTAAVLTLLADRQQMMDADTLAGALAERGHAATRDQVLSACSNLARTGDIERVRNGVYRAQRIAPEVVPPHGAPTDVPVPKLVDVTPQYAATLLEGNRENRSIRDSAVRQYARDMKDRAWGLNADAIAIAPDGSLLNGQHRLWAVIEADVTVPMWVIEGLPREAMAYLDTGRSRTSADYLGKAGKQETNPTALAAVLKLLALHDSGQWGALSSGKHLNGMSNAVLDRTLDQHPKVRESVRFARTVSTTVGATPREIAFSHYLISRVAGNHLADLYFRQVGAPVNEPAGSAVFAVASRLRQARMRRQRNDSADVINLLIRGWNKWSAGELAAQLPMPRGGKGARELPVVKPWTRAA